MPVPLLGRKRPTTGHRTVAPDFAVPLQYLLNQTLPVPRRAWHGTCIIVKQPCSPI